MASQEEVNRLVSMLQFLKNRDLASICYSNDLARSGNKAELQKRIINLIDSSVHDPNQNKFLNIKSSIVQVANGASPGGYSYRAPYIGSSSIPSSPSYTGQSSIPSPYTNGTTPTSTAHTTSHGGSGPSTELGRRTLFSHHGLQFKPSPFYEIEVPVGSVHTCEAMSQHRSSVPIKIRASASPDLQRCTSDPSMRALVFCAASKQGAQDIAFPYQCEIKINTGEVKANLRGLKNKPGSTRPVDITDHLRFKPATYENTLDFTYALTSKPFYLAIYVCKMYSATALASRIEKRGRITKASVIREVTRQAQDPDIVATSTVLSLKCPLTYMRLALPVRATTCKHIQCFDATSYLQLQEQGPQWLCPICSNSAPFDSLAVDDYVKDILENTPSGLDQVTIEPDGTWHTGKNGGSGSFSTPPPPRSGSTTVASLVDDEFEVVSTPVPLRNGSAGGAGDPANGHATNGGAPAFGSRDTTATPSQKAAPSSVSSSKKRPREVIDLTLSDDDDEPARRRQRVG